MANTFDFKLRGDADVSRIEAAINTIKKSMEGADLSASFSKQFATIFKNLTESQIKLSQNLSPINKDQFQEMLKFGKQVGTQYTNLVARIASVSQKSSDQLKEFLPEDTVNKIKKANSALDAYTKSTTEIGNKIKANNTKIKDWNKSLDETQQKLKEAKNSPSILSTDEIAKVQTDLATVNSEIEKINRALNKTGKDAPGAEEVKKLTAQLEQAYQKQSEFNAALEANKQARNVITDLTKEQNKLTESIKEATTANNQLSGQRLSGFTALKKTLSDLGFDVSQAGLKFGDFENLVKNFEQAGIQGVVDTLEAMAGAAKDGEGAFDGLSSSLDETKTEYEEFEKALKGSEELKNKVKQFFTAANAVQLFRRAITNAFNTIKELDAIMTETAVVTDFDVGDMWSQLPEYTERANKLGVAIRDTYKAATLYYQQGLKTNEVIGVSNQTLKMARIAGLDAAEATNKMTAALRGFNMEVTEANATRVSDVYSKLAAITASDVEEISSAMTKTASLASNAGMQFETTAAFLSQIIETTRESAETAGTALKTVIARFQELKKSPDEIGEVDGEIVDANKIEGALRTVGVSLRDASGQFRELDEVFLELASKWDTLDKNTQRYIATIAAGSRQQSRFIAMMSDYKRTQELVAAANNSAGAANQQYEKTLDSLDAKLKQLKNAYDEFTLSIANSDFIKTAVDLATKLVTILNKLTATLPKPLNGFAKLGMAIGIFKVGGKWVNEFSIAVKQNGVGAITALHKASANTFGGILTSLKKLSKSARNFNPIEQGRIIFNNLAIAEQQAASALFQYSGQISAASAAQAGLTQQCNLYNMALQMGISQENAKLLLTLSEAEAQEVLNAVNHEGNDALKRQIILDAAATKQQQAGLAVRWKAIGALLFGTGKKKADAMATLGLISAEEAKQLADYGATASQNAFNAALYACPLGIIVLALVAAVALLVSFAVALYKASDAAKMKDLAETVDKLEEATAEAKQRMEELSNAQNGLEELQNELDNLTKGTTSWYEQLIKVNTMVLELIEKYPLLSDHINNNNGVLSINEDGWQALLQGAQKEYVATLTASLALKQSISKMGLSQNLDRYSSINAQKDQERIKSNNWAAVGMMAASQFVGSPWGTIPIAFMGKQGTALQNTTDLALGKLESTTGGRAIEAAVANILGGPLGTLAYFKRNIPMAKDIIETGKSPEELAQMRSTGGLTNKEFNNFAASAFEQGIRASDENELHKLYQSLGYDESKWTTLYANIERLGDAFSKLGSTAAKLEAQEKVRLSSIMSTLSSNNADMQNTQFGSLIQESMENRYAQYSDVISQKVEEWNKKLTDDDFRRYAEITGKSFDEARKEDPKMVKTALVTQSLNEHIDKNMSDSANALTKFGKTPLMRYGQEGKNLYQKDIDAFMKAFPQVSIEELQNATKEQQKKVVNTYLKEFGTSLEILGLDAKTFVDDVVFAQERFDNATQLLKDKDGAIAIRNDITSEQAEVISTWLHNVLVESGKEAAQDLNNDMNSIIDSLGGEGGKTFLTALSTIDWKDSNAWNNLKDILIENGVTNLNESFDVFIEKSIALSNAVNKIDLSKFESDLNNLLPILHKIKIGEQGRIFDEEIAQKLSERYSNLEFVVDLDGNYEYIGAMQDLTLALQELRDALPNATTQMKTKVRAGEILSYSDYNDILNYSQRNSSSKDIELAQTALSRFVQWMGEAGEDVANLGIKGLSKTTSFKKLSKEELEYIGNELRNLTGIGYQDNLEAYNRLIRNDKTREALNYRVTQNAADTFNKFDQDAIEDAVLAQALQENVSIDKLTQLRDEMDALEKSGQANSEEWFKLRQQYSDYLHIAANTTALRKANKALQSQLSTVHGLVEEYDQSIDALTRFSIAQSIGDIFDIDVTKISADKSDDFVAAAASIIEGEEAGYLQLFNMAIQQGLNDTSVALWDTIEDAQKWLDNNIQHNTALKSLVETWADQNKWVVSEAIGGNEQFRLYNNKMLEEAAEKAGSKRKQEWENPYTWLYNMNNMINKQIQLREKLEREYAYAVEATVKTTRELIATSQKQLDILAQQRKYEEQRRDYAYDEITAIQNDSRYIHFFEEGLVSWSEGQGVRVNQGLVDQKIGKGSYEGQAFEAMVSRLEELDDVFNNYDANVDDIDKQVREIRKRGRDEYVEFENRVLSALVNYYTEQIDELETINNTLTDTNAKLISSIQETVSKQRQERQNQETEQGLSDKQRRLAYLQMDTSGANQTEILKLQEELAKDQQSYTDTLVDQAIDEMQSANEKAQEQREQQIGIMRSQLQYAQDAGLLWQEVETLIKDGVIADTGKIISGSSLETILRNGENWSSLSNTQQDIWNEELGTVVKQAMVFASQEVDNYIAKQAEAANEQIKIQDYYKDLTGGTGKAFNDDILDWHSEWKQWIKDQENQEPQTKVEVKGQRQQIGGVYGVPVVSVETVMKTGGLADFTGPAWLDGTPSQPELVLNSKDTQNFIALRDILSNLANNGTSIGGDTYYDIDIDVDSLQSDYDVEQLADKIRSMIAADATYRNVNTLNRLR